MPEAQKTIITSLSEILPNYMYNVNTTWDNCSINLSAQTLLDIAAYAQAHRTKLELEAQENIETLRCQLAETDEMRPVNPQRRHRTSDLPLSPLPAGSKAVNKGAESSQLDQLQDKRDKNQNNPEWRYRTSDLLLSPLPTGDKAVDKGTESSQLAQLQDKRDMSQINPEWRYRTSDLCL